MRGGLSRASSVGPKRVRIAVIGDSSAGKTTLLKYVSVTHSLLFFFSLFCGVRADLSIVVSTPACTNLPRSRRTIATTTLAWW